ncbi:MAG TPA: hypothetical protein VGD22_05680, partial [Sphingobacteriaceae bacterium]
FKISENINIIIFLNDAGRHTVPRRRGLGGGLIKISVLRLRHLSAWMASSRTGASGGHAWRFKISENINIIIFLNDAGRHTVPRRRGLGGGLIKISDLHLRLRHLSARMAASRTGASGGHARRFKIEVNINIIIF